MPRSYTHFSAIALGNARIPSEARCALVKPPIDTRSQADYNHSMLRHILVVDNENNDEA